MAAPARENQPIKAYVVTKVKLHAFYELRRCLLNLHKWINGEQILIVWLTVSFVE